MPVLNDIMNTILGSLRIGGLLLAMPVFSAGTVPTFIKVSLALVLGISMTKYMGNLPNEFFYNNEIITLTLVRELSIGLFIGFCSRFIFAVVSMSLEYAGIQMGFAMANIFDPSSYSQVTVLGQLGVIMTVLLFLSQNMHHDLFAIIVKSYSQLPVGYPDFNISSLANQFVDLVKKTFEISLRLSMPVLVVMLVIHTILGVIAKTAPQMNLFFNVAITLNVVVGIILVMMMLPQIIKGVFLMSDNVQRVLVF